MLHSPEEGCLFLSADVTPSLALAVNNAKHRAWVLTSTEGRVETADCTCLAGLGETWHCYLKLLMLNCMHCCRNLSFIVRLTLTGPAKAAIESCVMPEVKIPVSRDLIMQGQKVAQVVNRLVAYSVLHCWPAS